MSDVVLPYIKVTPTRIVTYGVYEGVRRKTLITPTFQGVKGSDKSDSAAIKQRKRLSDAVNFMIYRTRRQSTFNARSQRNVKWRVNFVTVTLSSKQRHDVETLKRSIFDPFLQSLRRRFKVKNYVWRVERQKNGNVHWHIITDTWVDWAELRNCWNRHQEKLGYVSAFLKKHGHASPNSTDVHAVSKKKDVAAYLGKYMGKGLEKGKGGHQKVVWGRLWGCNSLISQFKGFSDLRTTEVSAALFRLRERYRADVIEGEYFTMFKVNLHERPVVPELAMIKGLLDEYIRSKEEDLFTPPTVEEKIESPSAITPSRVLPCWKQSSLFPCSVHM